MRTPISDFLRKYADDANVRLHMPGHKGLCGIEKYDLTEVAGADSLFEASGIIRESEENAGELFGARTFFSTEGSSLSIRSMLYLATLYAMECGRRPIVLAARNAHRSFLSSAALIGFDVEWLYSSEGGYLSCRISAEELDLHISSMESKPTAVYITSPDYLGNIADIASLSLVCRKHGALLLVDNAHGAYLKFIAPSLHPMDLGADMCADSAHKTLAALTGAGYLHISKSAPKYLTENAKSAMALFASTSPSYLILDSLDRLNASLSDGYRAKLTTKLDKIEEIKRNLTALGYTLVGDEPMKITVFTKPYGYTGREISEILLSENIVSEFSDSDYLVLMPSLGTSDGELERLRSAFAAIPKKEVITDCAPRLSRPEVKMSPRDALFSPSERIATEDAVGRVLAEATVACPPAVPIVVSGEVVDESAALAFKYYGIDYIRAVK